MRPSPIGSAVVAWLAGGALALAEPVVPVAAPAVPVPPVFVVALPAGVSLIAALPAAEHGLKTGRPPAPDLWDLDLRVEVVLPRSCGDRVAGLLRHGGAKLDGEDVYDAVIERRNDGACKKDAIRVGARTAIRMRIADGATRELVIGSRAFKVARAGRAITLDGIGPQGDVPGAPPTAPPSTLIAGDTAEARITLERALPEEPGIARGTAVQLALAARWPKCAGPALGLLGRGDASTRFALGRFDPIALAPLDGSCGAPALAPRKESVGAVVRVAEFTVGEKKLSLSPARK